MDFRTYQKDNLVILDGGMGTQLQEKGLGLGEEPERWNLSHRSELVSIHKAYFDAGANVASANTFGINSLKFSEEEMKDLIFAAIENAKQAKKETRGMQEKFIALDIGSTGKLLKPLGSLDFEEAISIFKKTIQIGVQAGVDLILIETMNDSYETKAAVLAAKESCELPILVSNAYGEDGKLMTGATPEAMVALLEGLGVDAIGANCSFGPKKLISVAEKLLSVASIPVFLQPNAGMPRTEEQHREEVTPSGVRIYSTDYITIYDVTEEEFATDLTMLVKKGLRMVGGCCGTTPKYIEVLVNHLSKHPQKPKSFFDEPLPYVSSMTELALQLQALKEKEEQRKLYPDLILPKEVIKKHRTVVSSYTHAVVFDKEPVLIGERINPTGKKRVKQALLEKDMSYILSEGVSEEEKGANILDVNVGLPQIDEPTVLCNVIQELQAVLALPLQIDSSDPVAMEKALRIYNGKAMINSVNGKKESMEAVFPLVKKYGGLVVALTLDENGIPETAEGRVAIAKNILQTAAEYGIDKKDLIFDTLAMTISANNQAALATLEALHRIKTELSCHTLLGVSNVSFGLPSRDVVNGTFFALALENGLSAAIMNPHSVDMQRVFYSYRALKGLDENCQDFIAHAEEFALVGSAVKTAEPLDGTQDQAMNMVDGKELSALQYAIMKGFKEKAGELTKELLKRCKEEEKQDGTKGLQGKEMSLQIVNEQIIPALNLVGIGFEEKRMYLPQLLMSAEAAKAAFEVIKGYASSTKEDNFSKKTTFVLATVHGDIHDIGKNIVHLLLENYGFDVIDLGKDVPPSVIVDKVVELQAPLAGLSALMTTTVPAMEATIRMLKSKAPWCRTIVGGAVLTKEYAEQIGADFYAKDAMETVRYAQKIVDKV